jgi:hypothetical protein
VRRQRAYALLFVVMATVLVVTATTIALSMARDSSIAAVHEQRVAAAHAAATTGLQWMLANLSSTAGRQTLLAAAAASPGRPVAVSPGPSHIYRFDADGLHAGIPTPPPPAGTTTADWQAHGAAHFGLLAGIDPLDGVQGVLLRAIGVAGAAQVVLETNLQVTPTQNLPSAVTGCFPSNFRLGFFDQEGPYDYTGNFRIDGAAGVPLAFSVEHGRVNGLARIADAPVTVVVGPDEPVGVRWRGHQNLRSTQPASGVHNIFGGVRPTNLLRDGTMPSVDWRLNPFLANDPRIVDVVGTGALHGLGLGDGGGVFTGRPGAVLDTGLGATRPRGLPLIAFFSAPSSSSTTVAQGGLLGQSAWATAGDVDARQGFYACYNAGGSDASLNDATNVCLVGATAATATPDWRATAVHRSGRAWGFVQAVLRQCTGSGNAINPVDGTPWWHPVDNGNGVRCANGFEWLENLAACLIVPREAARVAGRGTNALRDDNPAASGTREFDDGSDDNNFSGCHPACLIATDVDGDGDSDDDDRPFRSVCINLDAQRVATYGPGMLDTRLMAVPGDRASSVFRTIPEAAANATAHRWTDHNLARGVPDVADVTDTKASRFVGRDGVVRIGGVVQERGNPALITRLDMSDRGPLGTCEQNCLAHGFGQDRTYGEHRNGTTSHGTSAPRDATTADVALGASSRAGTAADPHCVAAVPQHVASGTPVLQHCNWDHDQDGFLDRVSFALHSAYREECAARKDGLAWAPAFDISPNNEALLAPGGCSNDLPGRQVDSEPVALTPFCDGQVDTDLRADVERIVAAAQTITPSSLNRTGNLTDGNGWWGGARCHMGQGITFGGVRHDQLTPHSGHLAGLDPADTDRLGRPDYWIEDTCPRPVVVRVASSANLTIGQVCGCGILILPSQTLTLGSNAHLLWRGLVLWELKQAGRELQLAGSNDSTLVVDGALLVTGVGAMQIRIDKAVTTPGSVVDRTRVTGTVKQLYRANARAVSDAFAAVPLPLRATRRVR